MATTNNKIINDTSTPIAANTIQDIVGASWCALMIEPIPIKGAKNAILKTIDNTF